MTPSSTRRTPLRQPSGRPAETLLACLAALLALVALDAAWGIGAVDTAFADEPAPSASASAAADDDDDDDDSDESQSPEDRNLVDPTQRADNSFIYDTTIESLFKEASFHDNETVQVVGEVIGDRIAADRDGHCWITLTSTNEDTQETISVLLSDEQASQIDHFGRYGVTGTTFQVRGTYHQACQEHAGLPDIHATDSATIKRGVENHDKLRLRRFLPGVALVMLGLLLMGAYYLVREKMR